MRERRERERGRRKSARETEIEREKENPTPFIKNLFGASVPPSTESYFWPTMPSRKQRIIQKSDPSGDHCYVVALVRHVFRYHYLSSSSVTPGT